MLMAGGPKARAIIDLPEVEIQRLLDAEVAKVFPGARIEACHIQRWQLGNSFEAPGAPIDRSHFDLSRSTRRIALAGDYFEPLGSMNTSVSTAVKAVQIVRDHDLAEPK